MGLGSSRETRWIVLAAISVGAIAWRFAEPLDLRDDRSFEISEDPGVKVLEVVTSGGMVKYSRHFDLYADGSLSSYTVSGYASGTPQIIFTEELGRAKALELLTVLVESDVMEVDQEELSSRISRSPLPTDQAHCQFTIRLTRYRQRKADSSGFIDKRFGITSPTLRATQFPDIPQLLGLARVLDELYVVARRHRLSSTPVTTSGRFDHSS